MPLILLVPLGLLILLSFAASVIETVLATSMRRYWTP